MKMCSSLSSGLRYVKLVLPIMFLTIVCTRMHASEELPQSSVLSDSFQEQLTQVIECFDQVTDKRQIDYLSDILCRRYLVSMLFIAMPEKNEECERVRSHILALEELTVRLNKTSVKALGMFDDLLDTLNQFSYRTMLPEIARKLGFFELITGLIHDIDQILATDFLYLLSFFEQRAGIDSDVWLHVKKFVNNMQNQSDLIKTLLWDHGNTVCSIYGAMAEFLDIWNDIYPILQRCSQISKTRLQIMNKKISNISKKNFELVMLCMSYGDSSDYEQFKLQMGRAFFSSIHNAQLNKFLYVHLCRKIGKAPQPIFTLHFLAQLAQPQENSDERELLWQALKQCAYIGSHFASYSSMPSYFQDYIEKRLEVLKKVTRTLQTQRDGTEEGSKRERLSQTLLSSIAEKKTLEDEDWEAHIQKIFLLRPAYLDSAQAKNMYSVGLNAYLNFIKDHAAAPTVEQVLAGRGEQNEKTFEKTFFTGSEVVSDFCSPQSINCIARYVQLFFDYCFGKRPEYASLVAVDFYKKLTQGNTVRNNYAEALDLITMQIRSVPDWQEPYYDANAVKHLDAILKHIQERQASRQQCEAPQKKVVPLVEDECVTEPMSRPVKHSSRFGKKMAWQELLSTLEEIEQSYIPRVNLQTWSAEAGYAHCWRSQKSSLCVTYFFFKEARQQRTRKRDISLNISKLSKQTDRQGAEWDFYHAFPVELDHTLLNEYSVRIDQNHQLWSQLGLKRVRKSYAYVVRAKIVPGYTDPIRLQDPDFKDNDFGHTGYFVWLCRGKDVCYHRQFHPSSPRLRRAIRLR